MTLLKGAALENRARELGVDIDGDPRTQSSSGRAPRASDYELQRRVLEAERGIREMTAGERETNDIHTFE
jgi:hypothetical protein